jgi:hypothetical protein
MQFTATAKMPPEIYSPSKLHVDAKDFKYLSSDYMDDITA